VRGRGDVDVYDAVVVEGPYSFPGGRGFQFTDPSGNQLAVWTPA
jgi:predicted enzyme related to lactoylglutathione lyase